MPAPYGLEIIDNCASCAWRKDGFFCQLSAPALKSFEEVKFTSSYPANAVLFVEGQMPRGVYLLCKGRVKLTMTSAEGKIIILHIAEAGELIGINGAMSGKPYELSAETLEPCQVNFIKREAFQRLMHDHRDIGVARYRADQQRLPGRLFSDSLDGTFPHGGRKGRTFLAGPCHHREGNQSGNPYERSADARGDRADRRRLARDRHAHPQRPQAKVADYHQGPQRFDPQQAGPRSPRRRMSWPYRRPAMARQPPYRQATERRGLWSPRTSEDRWHGRAQNRP